MARVILFAQLRRRDPYVRYDESLVAGIARFLHSDFCRSQLVQWKMAALQQWFYRVQQGENPGRRPTEQKVIPRLLQMTRLEAMLLQVCLQNSSFRLHDMCPLLAALTSPVYATSSERMSLTRRR